LSQYVLFREDLLNFKAEDIESVVLVDFNQMEEEYHDKFENQVNHIVDHHHDNELYHLNIIKDRVIVKVGSACTLVTNLMVEKLDNLNEEEKAEFAMFISAPICIDTYLFKPDLKGNKWTEDDSKAFQLL